MKYEGYSIARMEAPTQWKEPAQKPEFDEVIMVMKGKMMVKVDGEKIVVKARHSMLIKRGSKVRYSNPFDQHSEYWSICLPPFSLSTVHRD